MAKNAFFRILRRMIPGVVMTVIFGALVAALFQSISPVLSAIGPALGMSDSDIATYTAITDQFRTAELNIPLLLTGPLCLALSMLTGRIAHGPAAAEKKPAHHGLRIAAAILLWVLFFLPIFAVTLYFTDVNTIRFGIALRFLLQAVEAGVF